MLMTALVAIFGITGTAVAAKRLVTGADIKNGSITRVDLSRSARDALRGKKGEAGVTGARGFKGARGAKGAKGSKGAKGVGGVIGIGGAQGGAGTNGRDGAAGTDGTNGAAGANGSPGTVGGQGAVGPIGPQGSTGTTGAQGISGTTGSQGVPGNTGTTGPQGLPAVRYFAAVASDGTLSTSRVHGVIQSALLGTGLYQVALSGAPDASACVAIAQVTGVPGLAFAVSDGSGNVAVTTFGANAVQNNRDFVLTISC